MKYLPPLYYLLKFYLVAAFIVFCIIGLREEAMTKDTFLRKFIIDKFLKFNTNSFHSIL